jgi:hypothetical protein
MELPMSNVIEYVGRRRTKGFGSNLIHAFDPARQLYETERRTLCGQNHPLGSGTTQGIWRVAEESDFKSRPCSRCAVLLKMREIKG